MRIEDPGLRCRLLNGRAAASPPLLAAMAGSLTTTMRALPSRPSWPEYATSPRRSPTSLGSGLFAGCCPSSGLGPGSRMSPMRSTRHCTRILAQRCSLSALHVHRVRRFPHLSSVPASRGPTSRRPTTTQRLHGRSAVRCQRPFCPPPTRSGPTRKSTPPSPSVETSSVSSYAARTASQPSGRFDAGADLFDREPTMRGVRPASESRFRAASSRVIRASLPQWSWSRIAGRPVSSS